MDYRKVGICFIIVSSIFSFSNLAFTGAVIGVESYGFFNILAIVFFLVGVVMVFVSGTLEQKVASEEGVVEPSEFYNNLHNYSVAGDKVFIIDNSFVASYNHRGVKESIINLRKEGTIVVTDSALKEIGGGQLRDFILKNSEPPLDNYESFKLSARECLEKSRKAFYYNEVVPIILGEKEPPKTRREADKYMVPVRKVVKSMNQKNIPLTKENLMKNMDSHWNVSDTDVDILAAAMAEANEGREAFVAERDVDFEDAIKFSGREHLHYANAYGRVA